jgi:hypothetical protein
LAERNGWREEVMHGDPHSVLPTRDHFSAPSLAAVVVFAGFNVLCVLVYRHLEGLRWQDAFFWITHPHSLEYRHIHDSTKFFAVSKKFVTTSSFAGRTVVDQLKRLEIPMVLIETNDGLYRELLKEGVLVIQGDALRHDVLLTAGIDRARGICIVIDNDADNLYITVTAAP